MRLFLPSGEDSLSSLSLLGEVPILATLVGVLNWAILSFGGQKGKANLRLLCPPAAEKNEPVLLLLPLELILSTFTFGRQKILQPK